MNKKIVVSSLLAIVATMALSTTYAAERKGPPGGGGKPPTEALEACADKSAADSCSFSSPHGDVTGTCMAPPNGDDVLACAPEGGPPAK